MKGELAISMSENVAEEFIVPRCMGKSFIVKKGQVLKVIEIGGGQVADIRFINAHDYREQFAGVWSIILNMIDGNANTYKRIKSLYSKVPWERLMLTVVEDTVGWHTMGGNCSRNMFDVFLRRGMPSGEFIREWKERSCQENFEEALRPYGLTHVDLDSAGVFNAFMPRPVDADGNIGYMQSPAKDGDFVSFLAEMDVLVAFSNCPCGPPVNVEGNQDFRIQILDSATT